MSSCQIDSLSHPHFRQHLRSHALHYLCQVEATFLFGLYLLEDLHHKMLPREKTTTTFSSVAAPAVAMQPQESRLMCGTVTQVEVSAVLCLGLNLQRLSLHCFQILKAWRY